jgi:hypothetical protein
MYSVAQLELMSNIFNSSINDTEFESIIGNVEPSDFSPDEHNNFIWWAPITDSEDYVIDAIPGKDKFLPIFSELAKNRKDDACQFYHFKSFRRSLEIIQNRNFQVTAMHYRGASDITEFSRFLESTHYSYMSDHSMIESYKRKSFILCFSNNFVEEKLWSEHAENDLGVCLKFNYIKKDSPFTYTFELRDVVYDNDDGNRFSFINVLREQFVRNFGKELLNSGGLKFASFYKGNDYDWENETRLFFNYNFLDYIGFPYLFPIQSDARTGREYLIIPFDNILFKLEIDEVICGRSVSNVQKSEIQSHLPGISVRTR